MIKDIVLTATGFAVGVALVSAGIHARYITKQHWRIWFVMARAGFAVAFALLLEALSKAPLIPGNWRTWVFVIACVITGIGFLGVARHDYRERNPDRGRFL